jgi:hypothetical protein
MSKTLRNVLAVFIFWVALFIVNKTGALTISSWISVACIARQSNRQPHNSMLFNVVNAICHLSGAIWQWKRLFILFNAAVAHYAQAIT